MLEFFRSRRRLGVVCGFLLLFAGLILAIPGVPGPGLALALLGLVILSSHFAWAKRLLDWARRKLNRPSQTARPLDDQAPARTDP